MWKYHRESVVHCRYGETGLVEPRRGRRTFTPRQKLEVVLAGLRDSGTVRDVCRSYAISEGRYYEWRARALDGALVALVDRRGRGQVQARETAELQARITQLEQHLRVHQYELEVLGNALRASDRDIAPPTPALWWPPATGRRTWRES